MVARGFGTSTGGAKTPRNMINTKKGAQTIKAEVAEKDRRLLRILEINNSMNKNLTSIDNLLQAFEDE